MGDGQFLIVEPDPDTAAVLRALCQETRSAYVVHTARDARGAIASGIHLTGAITELRLPDAPGLALLAELRKHYPRLPVLVLTSLTEPAAINRVHALRAEYHCKPTRRGALRGFLRRALAFEFTREMNTATVIEEIVRRRSLTRRESEILAASVAGMSRKELAERLGTTENTVKSQVKTLLRKCEHASLEELGRFVLQRALGSGAAMEEAPPSEDYTYGPPTIRPSSGVVRIGELLDASDAGRPPASGFQDTRDRKALPSG